MAIVVQYYKYVVIYRLYGIMLT